MSITKIQKSIVLLIILYVNWIQYAFVRSGIALTALTVLLLGAIAYDILFLRNGAVMVMPKKYNMMYSMVIYGAYALLSGFLVAANFWVALESLIQYISFTVVCICVFFIAEKEKSMKWLMRQFMICAVICSLQTILFGKPYHTAGVVVTTMSDYNNPNHLSLALIIGMFATVSDYEQTKKRFVLCLGVLLLCGYTVILTGSKKALLSMVVLVVFWAIMYFAGNGDKIFGRYTYKHLWRVLIVIIAVFAVVFYMRGSFLESSAFAKIERMFSDASSEDVRSGMYAEGIQIFKENPIFGIGFRHFQLVSYSGLYSHSTYIEILSCTGLIGAIIFFAPILVMLMLLLRKSFAKANPDKYGTRMMLVFMAIELFYFSVQIAVYEFDHMLVLVFFAWECYNRFQRKTPIEGE